MSLHHGDRVRSLVSLLRAQILSGPHPMTFSNLNYFLTPSTVTLKARASKYEFWGDKFPSTAMTFLEIFLALSNNVCICNCTGIFFNSQTAKSTISRNKIQAGLPYLNIIGNVQLFFTFHHSGITFLLLSSIS